MEDKVGNARLSGVMPDVWPPGPQLRGPGDKASHSSNLAPLKFSELLFNLLNLVYF